MVMQLRIDAVGAREITKPEPQDGSCHTWILATLYWKFAVRLSTLFNCFLPRKPAPAAAASLDNAAVSNPQDISAPTRLRTELVRESERGRVQLLRRAARHDPIPCINSALVNQTLTRGPNHVATALGVENHQMGFTVYSFGQRPTQNIKCIEKRSESNSFAEIAKMRDVKHVEPGDTESGKTRLFSGGFVNCTPVIAFYGNGDVAMHHSARYASVLPSPSEEGSTNTEHLDPAHLDALLDHPEFGRPTDLFVVAREGKQNQYTRQSGNSIYAVNHAQDGTSVHVIQVPPRIIAVDVTPGNLDVWLT
jgi:hypothetical protein